MNVYDCVVVGAGPAGLAYASRLEERDSVLVIDRGKPVEDRGRMDPEECILGAGGAGLFSDGKFSFYPSGTKIWEQDEKILRCAYKMLQQDLAPFKKIPPFPEIDHTDKRKPVSEGWHLKPYESVYLSLSQRIQLIQNLVKGLHIRYQKEFVKYDSLAEGYKIEIKTVGSSTSEYILAKKMVWAGGRFMPMFLECPKRFYRYELGFRVEGPSDLFEKEVDLVDPKYTKDLENGVECRTFCWCVNGEVVLTGSKGIRTYSGRADCPPTGLSNFGFNYRVKDSAILPKAVFEKILLMPPYQEKLRDLPKVLERFPDSFKGIIASGVDKLRVRFPKLNDDVVIKGPTIEGIGEYPLTNHQFSLEGDPNISVIGDCSGIYRGIVASQLSGYILAHRHNQQQQSTNKKELICQSH